MMKEITDVAVAGAGAMGSGIAQIAALAGCRVVLYDKDKSMLAKAMAGIKSSLSKLAEKGKISEDRCVTIMEQILPTVILDEISGCTLVIEAIIENLDVKQNLFTELESITPPDCILATNTSSLSIASVAAACKHKERVIGLHFFNPPVLMKLVEVIPSLVTSPEITKSLLELMKQWGKHPVLAKDTPGFIVNRLARPYYGEAIRIFEEGLAGMEEIDAAMKQRGGFRMGPFELMDFIGNDVNYRVTELVWSQMFYDPRYRPSHTQKRLFEAGLYGRKSGRGYYVYENGNPTVNKVIPDESKSAMIFNRIITMLINEAVEALYLKIATRDDLDSAMINGVNYRKGLLAWCDELGVQHVYSQLSALYDEYGDDRYRPSVLLKRMAVNGEKFYM